MPATQSNEVNQGGAIYNAGKMTMFEPADFRYNGGVVSLHVVRPPIVLKVCALARHGYACDYRRFHILYTGNTTKMR